MKMKLKLTLMLLLAFFGLAQAQTYDPQYLSSHPRIYTKRYSFWFEGNIFMELSKNARFQFQMDYQYRRMSDPSYIVNASKNIFKDRYQTVYRPWLHYWIKPGAIRLSLSPIGYWLTWAGADEAKIYLPTRGSNGKTGPIVFPEFRICPQITTLQKFGRVEYYNRFRCEFRFQGQRTLADDDFSDYGKGMNFTPAPVGSSSNDTTGISQSQRFRWQLRVQIPLSKATKKNQFYINTWNELFLSFGKYVPAGKMLNQNRTVALLGYKWNKGKFPVKFELGVTEQVLFAYNIKTPPTQPATVNFNKQNVELNTALQVYLVFDNFQKFFQKKTKPATQVQ